jgi:adenylate kinase family enzyme
MLNVFAHIAGSTGSGKSTLANRLSKKFPNIIFKDLDDIYRNLPSKYPEDFEKMDKQEFYKHFYTKSLEQFISENSNQIIIIVGFNGISFEKDFSDAIYYDINAEHKYFIDIDKELILKRRFERHLIFMANNVDRYFKKALDNDSKLIVDLDLWRKKINRLYEDGHYHNNNYKFMDNDAIYEDISKLLN